MWQARHKKPLQDYNNTPNPNNIKLFYSDYWKSYDEIIPKHKHLKSKAQTFIIGVIIALLDILLQDLGEEPNVILNAKNDGKYAQFTVC